ncbi:hypothetical protein CQA77_30485, partial [Klebsiella pneumoniae]
SWRNFVNCVLQGMSISAREGADFDKLMQITDTMSRSWRNFVNCVLQGMSISAREGADFDKLMQITD